MMIAMGKVNSLMVEVISKDTLIFYLINMIMILACLRMKRNCYVNLVNISMSMIPIMVGICG